MIPNGQGTQEEAKVLCFERKPPLLYILVSLVPSLFLSRKASCEVLARLELQVHTCPVFWYAGGIFDQFIPLILCVICPFGSFGGWRLPDLGRVPPANAGRLGIATLYAGPIVPIGPPVCKRPLSVYSVQRAQRSRDSTLQRR